jgi:hypothetical protein
MTKEELEIKRSEIKFYEQHHKAGQEFLDKGFGDDSMIYGGMYTDEVMYNKVKRETGLTSEYFEKLGKGGVK